MVESCPSLCPVLCLPTQRLLCMHFSPAFLEAVSPPYWRSYQEPHLQNSSIPYLIGYPFTPNSGSELWGSGAKPTRNPQ